MAADVWDYVKDIEDDYGVTIEEYPEGVLCGDGGCRHSECECWDNLKASLKWKAEAMLAEKFGPNPNCDCCGMSVAAGEYGATAEGKPRCWACHRVHSPVASHVGNEVAVAR
jgi:hypothetical protein